MNCMKLLKYICIVIDSDSMNFFLNDNLEQILTKQPSLSQLRTRFVFYYEVSLGIRKIEDTKCNLFFGRKSLEIDTQTNNIYVHVTKAKYLTIRKVSFKSQTRSSSTIWKNILDHRYLRKRTYLGFRKWFE